MKLNDWWLKFGCFLTGYNYRILSGCSEIAAKSVKRYTSALLIVSLMWAFIGYTFTDRYIKANFFGAIFGSIVFVTIIIQVERQIILSVNKNNGLYWFRGIIALMMAIIGSIIIDQIIFKEDIEQQKILLLDEKVNRVYPSKAKELKNQIDDLNSSISAKENERSVLNNDIVKNPMIQVVSETNQGTPITTPRTDSSGNVITDTKIVRVRNVTTNSIPNPKMVLMKSLDDQLNYLRSQKSAKDSLLLTLRPRIEEEIRSKVGFLDELDVMVKLLAQSLPALIVWLIWLMFLLGLELFILMSKLGGENSDYDSLILHQMETHKKKIELLTKKNHSLVGDSDS